MGLTEENKKQFYISEGFPLSDGIYLNPGDKDQKWLGLGKIFKFEFD